MSATQSPPIPTIDEIRAKLCVAAFGDRLISNIYRGLVAEVIVGAAIGSEWKMCSGDWRGWDFEHPSGSRLEVKQSAARQTWTGTRKATNPIFDIRMRTGYFERADWVPDPRRFAQIYVFAHHPIMDESADHRDPRQWQFHVVLNESPPGWQNDQLGEGGTVVRCCAVERLESINRDRARAGLLTALAGRFRDTHRAGSAPLCIRYT